MRNKKITKTTGNQAIKKKSLTLFLFISIVVFLMIYFNKASKQVQVLKEYDLKGQLIGINEYILKNNDTILNGKFIR